MKPIQRLLSEEEETEKFIAWREARDVGDERRAKKLLEELILHYTPIIRKMVKRMSGYQIDPEELISEGLVAVVDAANRFDMSKGFRFSTYATPWIKGKLYEFITNNYFMTNICSNSVNKKLFFSMRNHIANRVKRNGIFELTPELLQELATRFDVKEADIIRMNNILRNPYESLNEVVAGEDETGLTKEDVLESPGPNAEEQLALNTNQTFQRDLLQTAMMRLDERERAIFEHQLLQDKDTTATLEDLGLKFNISKERVRQIRNSAMEKVKKSLIQQLKYKKVQVHDFLY